MYKNQEVDSPAELESQFILRLPSEPARVLRDLIHNNANLKDRISVRIEDDMRHGEVRVDHWLLPAKVVDLPTIVESLKTIDGKGFYKTADICQMVVCREEGDEQATDEESPQKAKKRDPNKVEKKYLWPHGITPPTKNVRKRRFRKTLKKKYVEAPEIEKEVKRLLRNDNDAASVRWEIINEDEENKPSKMPNVVIKKEPIEQPENENEGDVSQNVAEHDIFGEAVSDSEEDTPLNVMELDENSDSHLTDSNSVMNHSAETKILTEFSSDMFGEMRSDYPNNPDPYQYHHHQHHHHQQPQYSKQNLSRANVEQRLDDLEMELSELKMRRQQQENKINTIENMALRQRFQEQLDQLLQEQLDKEQERYELQELLK